ncbi:MAG: MFS transporter, partial [Planctomycetota bacterium]
MLIGAIGVILQSWVLMLAMVGLMGTQSAFFSPALGGSIPEIFPRREVTRINARLRVAVTGAILLGVAGAGIALEAGPLLPEVLQGQAGLVAATILVVALGGVLTALRSPQLKPRNPAAPFPWTGVLDTLRELRRIYADPSLTLAVGVVVLVFFLGAVKILAANEMGIHQLNLGEGLTGAINFATLTGVAAGGMLSSWVTRRLSWRRTVFPVTLGLCASLFLLGGLPFLPPLLRAPSVYLLLFGAGTAGGMMLIPSQAFIQTRPDPDRRGAVIAASNFAVFSGILLSGPLASGLLALLRQPGIAAIGIIRRNLILPPQIQRPLHMMSLLNPSSVFPVLAVLTLTVICWLLWRLPPPEEDTSFTDKLLAGAVRFLLSLRYRIDVRGLERVEKKGCRGILFLPNHPALIDPIILLSILYPRFAPRAWAIEHQIDRFLIRHLARRIGVLTFPAFGDDPDAARERLQDLKRTSVEQLKRGRNFLIYPSGHAYRTGQEDLRGNSAVREILNECPDARVVLVRTRGLWGSSFSWAQGHAPHVGQLVKDAIKTLLSNGIFFTPRRRIVVEFAEPANLPRKAGTKAFNNYLERFYNHTAHPPIYVPYTVWEKGPPRRYFSPPSPQWKEPEISGIPESVRDSVTEYLQELTGVDNIQPADYLGRDLGVDSLDRAEALAWMDSRWGVTAGDADSVRTVSDLMLAATGEAPGTEPEEIEPPPAVWRAPNSTVNDDLESAVALPEAVVQAAVQNPDAPIFADQHSGVLTYRRLLTAIFALKTQMEKLPGNRVGIMLPASVGG